MRTSSLNDDIYRREEIFFLSRGPSLGPDSWPVQDLPVAGGADCLPIYVKEKSAAHNEGKKRRDLNELERSVDGVIESGSILRFFFAG